MPNPRALPPPDTHSIDDSIVQDEPRHLKFAREYLSNGLNANQAAKAAGYSSNATVYPQLANPNSLIRKAIDQVAAESLDGAKTRYKVAIALAAQARLKHVQALTQLDPDELLEQMPRASKSLERIEKACGIGSESQSAPVTIHVSAAQVLMGNVYQAAPQMANETVIETLPGVDGDKCAK